MSEELSVQQLAQLNNIIEKMIMDEEINPDTENNKENIGGITNGK